MNHDFETADGKFITLNGERVRGTFPRWWGKPPSDPEERGRWIRDRIREGEERMDRGEKVEGQKPRTGKQAMASLRRRAVDPVATYRLNQLRLELLADLRRRWTP